MVHRGGCLELPPLPFKEGFTNYYNRYLGDYLRDTQHLTILEHGAYTVLLDIFYSTEKCLPFDRDLLYHMTRAKTAADRAAIDKILAQFWKKTHGGYANRRARKEISAAQSRIKAARENGKQGGRPKTQTKPTGFPENNPGPNPDESSPSSIHHPPRPQEKVKGFRAIPWLEGFQLDADMMVFANEHGVNDVEEFEKFKDHHKAKGSLFKDWKAAWRNWVRKSVEMRKENRNGTVPKSFDQIRNERTDAALARVIEHVEKSGAPVPGRSGRTNDLGLLPRTKRPPN